MNIRELKKITRDVGDVQDPTKMLNAMRQYETILNDIKNNDVLIKDTRRTMSRKIGTFYISKVNGVAMYLIKSTEAALKPTDMALLLDSINKGVQHNQSILGRVDEQVGQVLRIETKVLDIAEAQGYAEFLDAYALVKKKKNDDIKFSITNMLKSLVSNPRIAILENDDLYPLDVMLFAISVGGVRAPPPPPKAPEIPKVPEIPRVPGILVEKKPDSTFLVNMIGAAASENHPYRKRNTVDLLELYKEELFSVFNMKRLPYYEAFDMFAAFVVAETGASLEGVTELIEDFFETIARWLIYRFGEFGRSIEEHKDFSAISLLRTAWRLRSSPIPAESLLKMALFTHATSIEGKFSNWPVERKDLVAFFSGVVDKAVQEPTISTMNELLSIASTRPSERTRSGIPPKIIETCESSKDAANFIWKSTFESRPGKEWEGEERINKLEELQAFNLLLDPDEKLDVSVMDFIPTESVGDVFKHDFLKGRNLDNAISALLKELLDKVRGFTVLKTELYENIVFVMAIMESKDHTQWEQNYNLTSKSDPKIPVKIFATHAASMDPQELKIGYLRQYFNILELLSSYMSSMLLPRQDIVKFGRLSLNVLDNLEKYIRTPMLTLFFELEDPGYSQTVRTLFELREGKDFVLNFDVLVGSWNVFFHNERDILDFLYKDLEHQKPSLGAWLRDWVIKYALIWLKYRGIPLERKEKWLELYRENMIKAFLTHAPNEKLLLHHVISKRPQFSIEVAEAYKRILDIPETGLMRIDLLSLRGAKKETGERLDELVKNVADQKDPQVSDERLKNGFKKVFKASSVIRYPLISYMRHISDPFVAKQSSNDLVLLFEDMFKQWIPRGELMFTQFEIGFGIIGRMELFFRNTQETERRYKGLSAPFQVPGSKSILPILIFSAGSSLISDSSKKDIFIELYDIHSTWYETSLIMTMERFGIMLQALFFQRENYGDLKKNQGYRLEVNGHKFDELFEEDWTGKDWLKTLYIDSLEIIDIHAVLKKISPVKTPMLAFLMIWCLYRGYIDERELPIRYKAAEQTRLFEDLRTKNSNGLFGEPNVTKRENRYNNESTSQSLATSIMTENEFTVNGLTMNEFDDPIEDLESGKGQGPIRDEMNDYAPPHHYDDLEDNNVVMFNEQHVSKRPRLIMVPDLERLEAGMKSGNRVQALAAMDPWNQSEDIESAALGKILGIKERFATTLESWGDVRERLDVIITDISPQ